MRRPADAEIDDIFAGWPAQRRRATHRVMLETPRLRLVPLAAEHFDALAAMYADPEVARFLDGAPLDRPEAWRRLALHLGHWALRGYGTFACIERSSGAFPVVAPVEFG